jgi:hypothetical protein
MTADSVQGRSKRISLWLATKHFQKSLNFSMVEIPQSLVENF